MFGTSNDLLEDDLREPYTQWKKTPTSATNAAMLKALRPTIDGAIRVHVGEPNPLLVSRARIMAIQGLPGYDPSRGHLQGYMYNYLRGLKRVNRKQTMILKAPERVALDRFHLDNAVKELTATLGQEPTDEQLAEHTGFSPARLAKVRRFNTGIAEGYADLLPDAGGEGSVGAQVPIQNRHSYWADVVYDELDDYHKRVMEHAFGLNGRAPLQNQEIAKRLNRSPGAISQAKARIQRMLDEEHALDPFGSGAQ